MEDRPYTKQDVTFVVIGKNEGKNLERCFTSISNIGCRFIYVDSNSVDDSVDIALASGADRVLKLESNFYSASLARSIGAKECCTPLMHFIDGDMTINDSWLEFAVDFLNVTPKACAVHGFKREYKTLDTYKVKADKKNWKPDYLQGSYLIKTESYFDAGGLDPRFPGEEERDLYVRLTHAGSDVWYLHRMMASHYDFKDRGLNYLLKSEVAGAIFVPFVKHVFTSRFLSYCYVYRLMLPIFLFDVLSLCSSLVGTMHGLFLAVCLQLTSLLYAVLIDRKGYFVIWKFGMLNLHRTLNILNKKIDCSVSYLR